MLRKTLGSLSLVAVLATGAAAQIPFHEGFTFVSGSSDYSTYLGEFTDPTNIGSTGELLTTTNNAHPFQVWCVDPMEYVNDGQTSNPYITSLTVNPLDFSNTLAEFTQTGPDHGNGDVTITHTAVGDITAQAQYSAAAWLASQMTSANNADVEAAMWTVMGYSGHDTSITINNLVLAASVGAALDPNFHADEWAVITSSQTEQEFIYHRDTGEFLQVVPEPATMSMMAMGLVGMVGGTLRRRKQRKA